MDHGYVNATRFSIAIVAAVSLLFGTGAKLPDHLRWSPQRTVVFSMEPTASDDCADGAELRDSYGRAWPVNFRDEVFLSIEDLPRVWFANRCQDALVVSGPIGIGGVVMPGEGELMFPKSIGLVIISEVGSTQEPLFVQVVNFPID